MARVKRAALYLAYPQTARRPTTSGSPWRQSPPSVAGPLWRHTRTQASVAPRDATSVPAWTSCSEDATRAKFDVVMAWALDRLGRSLADLISTLRTLEDGRVDLFLHQQAIDTTTPAGACSSTSREPSRSSSVT